MAQENFSRLPKGYLKDGYYQKNGALNARYVSRDSIDIARMLDAGECDQPSQIRKFYEMVVNLQALVSQNYMSYDQAKVKLLELSSYANYAYEREKVSRDFLQFIQKNTEAVHSVKDLEAFKRHFETVICYRTKVKDDKK